MPQVQIPLVGGYKQKQQNEWLDPSAGQGSITNGQFTKEGSIAKRLGMQFMTTFTAAATLSGAKFVSWSRQAFSAIFSYLSGNAFLSQFNVARNTQGNQARVPSPRTIRRALSNVPTYTNVGANASAITPVVIDTTTVRLVFTVFGNATYVSQIDLVTGDPLGATYTLVYGQPAAAITGFQVTGGPIVVLLQIAGSSTTLVGLTMTGVGSTAIAATVATSLANTVCADIAPFVGDPSHGWMLFYQTSAGVWSWRYYTGAAWTTTNNGTLETTAAIASLCSVAATYGGNLQTGAIGFFYRFNTGSGGGLTQNIRFADMRGDGTFAIFDSPTTVATSNIGAVSPPALYLGGLCFIAGRFYAPIWALQTYLNGIFTPQWLPIYITPGSVPALGASPAMTSYLGMWPVGRPFTIPGQATSDVYQPCVLQLKSLATGGTLGSFQTFGVAQSGQCTLYLLDATIGSPVSTAAPRIVDPSFSLAYLNFPTGSFPQNSYVGTRFAVGLQTLGSEVPGVGYVTDPCWYTDWFFDAASQGLLFQSNEVTGDNHIQCSVPMVADGQSVFEDGFFYYPEFATATTPGGVWPNAAGQYIYCVVYTYVDATGQLWRSAPVFTPNASGQTYSVSVTNGGNAPTVTFPAVSGTYRPQVNAEIYRNIMISGVPGGTFYLVAVIPATFQTAPTGYSLNAITLTSPGAGYTLGNPGVTISGGGGTGATATATAGGGGVSSFTINNSGNGYTSSFAFPIPTGTGGQGYANVGLLPGGDGLEYGIISINVTAPGVGYTNGTSFTLSGGGGSNARVTLNCTTPSVASITLTNAGSGYTSPPTVSFSYGSATATATLANPATGLAALTYVDTVSDTQIQQSTVLYTTGGVLDCVNPPSASAQCIHWNRKWIVDETLTTIWFTQAFQSGLAPAFNESLSIYYPDGGDITAIAGMDDKLVIFKLNSISVVYGQGPLDNGQGSDLTLPQPIATDSGAVDWRSVVLMPLGLMFQSRTGIYLLDRSLNVTWIGKDVVDLLNAYSVVLSAALVPTATHVRFVCQNPSNGFTIVLVYDYLVQSWTTFQYNYLPAALVSSAYVNTTFKSTGGTLVPAGTYATISGDGSMWRELNPVEVGFASAGPYFDTDQVDNYFFVPTSVTTAWVKVQGLQGYMNIRKILTYAPMNDPAGLVIGFAFNYNPTVLQQNTWFDTEIAKLPVSQVEMHAAGAYNKSMSIQVTMSDYSGTVGSSLAVTGQGASFVSCGLDLQQISDRYPAVPVLGRA